MASKSSSSTTSNWRVAIVVARFNSAITEKLLEGAVAHLMDNAISADRIDTFHVPGAIEIPLAAQRLLEKEDSARGEAYYAGIIALGAVIRGETGHYDYVCEQASQGCLRVSLDYNTPIAFGVLTTDNVKQALARAGGEKGHHGKAAAQAILDMLALFDRI